MSYLEAFMASLGNLAAHKLRSLLAMLGVVFGVGAVISMLSIGAGAELQAMGTIERLGLRNVIVRSRSFDNDRLLEIREHSIGLSMRDCEAIREAVPGVESVAPKVEIAPYAILAGSARGEGTVYGVVPEHQELADLELEEGRFVDALDEKEHAQVCVIGPGLRRELFQYKPALGAALKVNDVWLTVVGVLAARGGEGDTFQGVSLGSSSRAIYVPVTTALRRFDHSPLGSPLSEIIVHLEDSEDDATASRTAARSIEALLSVLHGGMEDYVLVVPEGLLEQSRRTQRIFNIVMGCIAGISLLVGGIGIMNIMLASVLERTREIGLRRAVGARRRDILVQFLVESFAISAFGGLIGVFMGLGISRAVGAVADWPTVVTPLSVFLATGVAVVVGVSSGFYPARRAADLDPIQALHYE